MCLTDIDVIKREYDLRECSFTHPEMHVNLSSYIFPLRHLRVVMSTPICTQNADELVRIVL
jgi:hypothetical protein